MAKYLKETEKKRRKWPWVIVLILSFCLIVGAILFLDPLHLLHPASNVDKQGVNPGASLPTAEPTEPVQTEAPTEEAEEPTAPTETETTEPLPDNRVDWAYYKDINTDIYAWIYVPGTGIDLPVLQAYGEDDDNFYLHHNMYREYQFEGIPYTQKMNSKDFSDPVTVIYGHNMLQDGVMFTNLLYYQDADFFEENEFFYIYQPQRVLTYRIVSAHSFDTRHILNSFDFSKETEFQDYLNYILAPRTMIANVREGVDLTTDDRIVTLSTCIRVNGEKIRYLIQGVLVDDQQTN